MLELPRALPPGGAARPRARRADAFRPRPFEISDTYYTAGWSAYETGHYRVVLALAAEFEAQDADVPPLGIISNSVLARVPLGTWDEALADQAHLRELLGDRAGEPPSFASGGYGAAALIHEARGDHAATDALLAEIEAWIGAAERPRLWAMPQAAVAMARRGDSSEPAGSSATSPEPT